MTAKEFVLEKYPDAVVDTDKTREGTVLYCVKSPAFPAFYSHMIILSGLSTDQPRARSVHVISVWRFSEEHAWEDAMRRLSMTLEEAQD